MLAQHDKKFGKKKHIGEDVFFTQASTSKSSTGSSRSRGNGHFNKIKVAHTLQGRCRSQTRGNNFNIGYSSCRRNFQGNENNQGRDYNQGREQILSKGKTHNRGQSRGKGQYQGRGRDLSQIVYRRCNKVGHFTEDYINSIDKIPKFHQNTSQFGMIKMIMMAQNMSSQTQNQQYYRSPLLLK